MRSAHGLNSKPFTELTQMLSLCKL
jgi:hypothetical protein